MPAQISRLEIMDEDRLIEEVLDKFVNCHEQTYEEFLSTFTHLSKDLLLLPGEVEQEVSTSMPSYSPSVGQPLSRAMKPKPTITATEKQMEEILGDEVQPFSLDEEFDYDNVILTPKFSLAEIETIKELSKQKRKNTNTDLEEPHD
ncbi:intraflagellar transport-associated protein isoform X2 [Lemur catta]|uniref:intraflagellar transport-associated protein isoform X2 n=1 Tax=Lemur catta TaxID=9447 RepID=UPI001E26A323|nr:intraflagellar transport-associated protein isoform X2 [Lemur catta]